MYRYGNLAKIVHIQTKSKFTIQSRHIQHIFYSLAVWCMLCVNVPKHSTHQKPGSFSFVCTCGYWKKTEMKPQWGFIFSTMIYNRLFPLFLSTVLRDTFQPSSALSLSHFLHFTSKSISFLSVVAKKNESERRGRRNSFTLHKLTNIQDHTHTIWHV